MEPTNLTREETHGSKNSPGGARPAAGNASTKAAESRTTGAVLHRESPHDEASPRQESARTRAGNGSDTRDVVDHARHAITDAYDRTSETVQKTYKNAVDYGRENPMKTMLMVFGAGVGAGLLIASSTKSAPRDRTSRIVPSVANALANVVTEIFR